MKVQGHDQCDICEKCTPWCYCPGGPGCDGTHVHSQPSRAEAAVDRAWEQNSYVSSDDEKGSK